jgi:CheY-like chemotaxis protein
LWGHSVEISHDGFAALDLAKTFRPSVILADLGMPRMSGYEFAKEVRRLPELDNTILVALTGYGRESDQQQSLAAGFSLHLIKPIDPAELMRVLATLEAKKG